MFKLYNFWKLLKLIFVLGDKFVLAKNNLSVPVKNGHHTGTDTFPGLNRKMFLVTIILKNLWTLKSANGQTYRLCPFKILINTRRLTNILDLSLLHNALLSCSAHKCAKNTYFTRFFLQWIFPCASLDFG